MKKLFVLFSALVLSAVLVSCGGSASKYAGAKELKGYALSHNWYVTEATVWVKDDKIIDAELVEWFLPNHFASTWTYDGIEYTVAGAGATATWLDADGNDFRSLLLTEAGVEKYINAIKGGLKKIEIVGAPEFLGGWHKDAANYGDGLGHPYALEYNFGAIELFAIQNSDKLALFAELDPQGDAAPFRFKAKTTAGLTQAATANAQGKKLWSVGTIVLYTASGAEGGNGASCSDVAQYLQALARAYAKRK
jgi:hypothetical protein